MKISTFLKSHWQRFPIESDQPQPHGWRRANNENTFFKIEGTGVNYAFNTFFKIEINGMKIEKYLYIWTLGVICVVFD